MTPLASHLTFVQIDCEFTPDLHTPDGLVSIALHAEGRSLYLVNAQTDQKAFCRNEFCRDEIWAKLPLRPDGRINLDHPAVTHYQDIKNQINAYFYDITGGRKARDHVALFADHGTQDVQRLHNLFGNDWSQMPEWIPKHLFQDIATLEDLAGVVDGRLPSGETLPTMGPEEAHNALRDAAHGDQVLRFLLEHSRAVRVACGVEVLGS